MAADGIIAIATAPGRGGVGVIRISVPPQAVSTPDAIGLFCSNVFGCTPKARYAHHVRLTDASGAVLDEGLLLYFPAPASFTGEHVIEFQGHGGPALLRLCLVRLLEAGETFALRLARAGEFTQRAFLNGKLDLAQAEAVADLIDAGSERSARAAMSSLQGVFSRQVDQLAQRLIQLRLLVEATLDFPEEEIDFLQQSDARGRLTACRHTLSDLLRQARQSVRAAAGLRIVIVGEPNVGKSSLLNALTGEDRAIVTPIAGTTRDSIHQEIELDGIRMTLIDTAGLRSTDDPVEQIGIERTLREVQSADCLLILLDASIDHLRMPSALQSIRYDGPRLTVLNKMDLCNNTEPPWAENLNGLLVSARTGQGLDALKRTLFEAAQCDPDTDLPFLARERHVDALRRCQTHLIHAEQHADNADASLDLFAEELRLSHDALGEITGRLLPDDLLGLIFERFCIGK